MFRLPGPLALRIGVLLTVLLSANCYVFIELYRVHLRGTVAPRIAAPIAAQIRAIRVDLSHLHGDARVEWLAQFNAYPLPHLEQLPAGSKPTHFPISLVFLIELQGYLQQQAGQDITLGYDFDDLPGTLMLEFDADGGRYLLIIPGSGIQSSSIWPYTWLILSNLVIVVLGVMFAIWQINQPLQRTAAALARSSSELAEIEMPSSAPAEFRVFADRFNLMARRLKAQERERALLLAGVSHDLRAPLNRIRLRAELIDDDVPDMATGLIGDADSMRRIIDQFLDYQRTLVQANLAPLDLRQRLGAIVARCREMGRDIGFSGQDSVNVLADPAAIDRIANNLIDNAFAHGAEPVEIDLRHEADTAVIEIRDHGKGIDLDDVPRLLQPFERKDKARSMQGHCGLGLSIVNRLVAELGGNLSLDNHPGGGLVAQIRLPVLAGSPGVQPIDGQATSA